LTTNNINPTLANTGGASGFIFGYTESIKWDPVSRQLFFIGMDHNQPSGERFVSYAESTNSWQILPQPAAMGGSGVGNVNHGYDHHALDPANRYLYFRYGFAARSVYRYQIDTKVWTKLSDNNVLNYSQCCGGLDYFPELNGVVWAQAGENGNWGGVFLYSYSSGQWQRLGAANSYVMGTYHNFAEYNPINKVLVFGGGNGSSNIYKLTASGVVTQLKTAPFALGIQRSVFTVDPVSGDYLVLNSAKEFWKYNVNNDAWTRLPDPPSGIWGTNSVEGPVHGMVAGPVNTYGVISTVVCRDNSNSNCHIHLYKHASSGTTPPPAPAPTLSLSASALSITSGQSSTLNWSSTDATSCTASAGWSGTKTVSGSQVVTPTATTTYSLTCTGTGGNATQSVTVTVTSSNPNPPPPSGVLQVGSGRQYTTIAAALAAAQSGNIIEIDAGVYNESLTISKSNLIFRGTGGYAHLKWGTGNYLTNTANISNGKGLLIITGSNITIENFEFSGAKVVDENGAAIRYEGGDLTIRGSYFHDNENGILGNGGPSNTVLIENSIFERNGYCPSLCAHNVYIGQMGRLIFRYNKSTDSREGHPLKSRASVNEIISNFLSTKNSDGSYEADFPNGGTVYFIGNVIEQGANTGNPSMLAYGAEGVTNPNPALYVINNTFYNYRGSGIFVQVGGSPVLSVKNNIFAGGGTTLSGGSSDLSSNKTLTSSSFVNTAAGNYHLTSGSAAINTGVDPGSAGSYVLTPQWEYVDPANKQARPVNGNIDVGAYEYSGTTSPSPGAFDFSVSNGGNRSVNQGSSITNTIAATLSSGTAQSITFSVFGLPTGATGSLSPGTCSPTCTTTLSISTLSTTPIGNSTVVVTASGGSLTKTSSFILTVNSTSTPPPPTGIVGGYPIPSAQDEKNTYTSWGWTWTVNKEPAAVTEPIANYSVANPSIHGDTEGDDLWTYLMMYRRTGNTVYLNRATAWANYFKNGYRQCLTGAGQNYCYDRDNFGLDHVYGYGLIAWYEHTGDTAALTAAENIAADIETLWNPGSSFGCYPTSGCLGYGPRGPSRHLLIATRLASLTGKTRWITLRDKILNTILNSGQWNSTYGTYFVSPEQTDYAAGAGAYASGVRMQSAFQLAILTEALAHAYRATGNQLIRDRLVSIARFVNQYGLDPAYQYTGNWFGIKNGEVWHNYSSGGSATFWDPVYTTSLVNVLVRGYKYTGDGALLNRAKVFFNRGTKGVYGSTTQRQAGDNVVGHFIDTTFDSSTGNFYLAYNKGELQYTYLVFENGGSPTIEAGTPPLSSPLAPSGLTLK
jgi:hypothetical protein